MNLEQYRKNVESGMVVDKMRKDIKSAVKQYKDAQLMGYEAAKLKYKPIMEAQDESSKRIIKSQEKVQEAIDEKQDKLIKQLQQNQLALDGSFDDIKLLALKDKTPQDIITIAPRFDKYLTEEDKKFIDNNEYYLPSELFEAGIKSKWEGDDEFKEWYNDIFELRNDLAKENKNAAFNKDKK